MEDGSERNKLTTLAQMHREADTVSGYLCERRVRSMDFSCREIISRWSWPSLSAVIAAGKRLRLWHTSCGPLVPSPPPSLSTSVTQTHAKQATVSTASHIQLQMSPLWAPVPFDVMNNEDEFSFMQVSENPNAHCLRLSHQAVRSMNPEGHSCPGYIPTNTIQTHMLTDVGKFVMPNIGQHVASESDQR